MRICVTGSSGLIGSILCKSLKIPEHYQYDILNSSLQDVTNEAIQDEIVSKSDVIIHLAALSGLKACQDNPSIAKSLNTDSTIMLAKKAKSAGVRRFVFPSSSAVYGEACEYNMNESHPTNPRSLYGETKLAAEKILDFSTKKFEVVIFRKSNVYGYGLIWKGITVIDQFIEKYLKQEPMRITGSGSQKRDFIHLIDAMRMYSKVALAPSCRSGIYNLGGSESYSIRALAELINDIGESIFSYRVPLEFGTTKDEVLWHDFKYDWSRAQMEFQYRPAFTIDDYVKERMLKYLREKF